MTASRLTQWLDRYAECHQNPINKVIHWVCVPVIMMTLLGLLWQIPFPDYFGEAPWWLNWSMLFIAAALMFYVWLSPSLALGMLLWVSVIVFLIRWYTLHINVPLWIPCCVLFVVAWIGQFIGHKIERKKPAFFEDLQFLLIGPLWVLSFLYRKLGLSI